jgi:integrase
MPRRIRTPSYRLHRQSGQAIVTLPNGRGGRRDVLLGPYDTPESRDEYDRVIAEWLANGRLLVPSPVGAAELSVNELLLAYWQHAERYYRHPDGTPTSELHCLRTALRPLRQLYGPTPARSFGALSLEAVRNHMIALGWGRKSINLHVSRIKSLFKWGVAKELVPASVHHALLAVAGLRAGRSAARETAPVRPVPEAFVEATLPHANPVVRAMIAVQQLTGMRPGEVVVMRACDLDVTAPVWLYRPGSESELGRHKTAHHGHQRVIAIGPKGQEVIRPFLRTDLRAYLFQPGDAVANPRWKQRRRPNGRYTVQSYRQAVRRACLRADAAAHKADPDTPADQVVVPVWRPHQLRHTKATEIRREAGLDAARAVLGHRKAQVTEVYAELDVSKAAEVMSRLG